MYEKDVGKDDRIAQFTAPMVALQQGLRSVRLLNSEMEILGAASLLVDLHLSWCSLELTSFSFATHRLSGSFILLDPSSMCPILYCQLAFSNWLLIDVWEGTSADVSGLQIWNGVVIELVSKTKKIFKN